MKLEQKKNVKILGIESSCDETAASIVMDGRQILSNIIASQIPVHRVYGGVVPEIASRHHLEAISQVVAEALSVAACVYDDVDAIAVTQGPGLVGSLLVGLSYAKGLAFALGKPLIAVDHWQAHLYAAHIEHEIAPPYLALVVSGSHSGLLLKDKNGSRMLGKSHDDAAGEAFDKIARALGLPYPGGPEISAAAEKGESDYVHFPRAFLPGTDDFSFSGLKSAVLNYLNQRHMKGDKPTEQEICSIAASAQEAIVDVLAVKTVAAAKREKAEKIVLVGGVAANNRLRQLLLELASAAGMQVFWPSPILCTDNAAMVAAVAYEKYLKHDFAPLNLNASPRLGSMQ